MPEWALLDDMQKHAVRARQLTLKLKDTRFRLWERSTQLDGYSCSAATIEKAALSMLDKELELVEGVGASKVHLVKKCFVLVSIFERDAYKPV